MTAPTKITNNELIKRNDERRRKLHMKLQNQGCKMTKDVKYGLIAFTIAVCVLLAFFLFAR